jgi:DNA (cytosine-5)-methyltransferase 1
MARLPGHYWDGVSPTLRAGTHGGDNQPSVAYGISSVSSYAMNSSNPRAGIYETDTAKTINTSSQVPSNQGGLVVCTETYAMTTGSYAHAYKGHSPTLLSRDFKGQPVVDLPPKTGPKTKLVMA